MNLMKKNAIQDIQNIMVTILNVLGHHIQEIRVITGIAKKMINLYINVMKRVAQLKNKKFYYNNFLIISL